MARKLKSDRVLFTSTVLLIGIGVVMVYSASAVLADDRYGRPDLFLVKQALWGVLGLAALAVAMRVDYRTYRNDAFIWTGLGAVCLLLALVLVFGTPVNGARRWFNVGGLGIQPSEFAKLGAVFFTALVLDRRMHRIDEVSYSLLPIAIVVGAMFTLIVLQPDMGTALALLLIVGMMVFAAGLGYGRIAGAALVALPVLLFVIVSAPYRMRRLVSFVDPWADLQDDGWQLVQSFIAVGTGGVFGRGLMEGVQKLFFLPEPHTDFIYAVIGEELGLLGATAVSALRPQMTMPAAPRSANSREIASPSPWVPPLTTATFPANCLSLAVTAFPPPAAASRRSDNRPPRRPPSNAAAPSTQIHRAVPWPGPVRPRPPPSLHSRYRRAFWRSRGSRCSRRRAR
jgi:cell division protein FtsW